MADQQKEPPVSARLPCRWDALSTSDFKALATGPDADRTVAILPISATEQHGPHLPVAVDATINRGILDRALARLPRGTPVLTLPDQPIGYSPEHDRSPGTLTLSTATAMALWTDIIASVAAAGIRRLLVFNSHGGQIPIARLLIREARTKFGMLAATVSWPDFGIPADLRHQGIIDDVECRHGLHAGQTETSMMMALAPDAVRRSELRRFASRAEDMAARYEWLQPEGAVRIGWRAEDLNAAGATGDAAKSSAAIGEALIDHAAAALATLLIEMTDPDLTAEWLS